MHTGENCIYTNEIHKAKLTVSNFKVFAVRVQGKRAWRHEQFMCTYIQPKYIFLYMYTTRIYNVLYMQIVGT